MPATALLHAAVVPPFAGGLRALKSSLAKGEAHARERGYDPARLLAHRLAPDMFDLAQQARIASDWARKAGERLAGLEPGAVPDDETTIAQLTERLERTAAGLEALDPARFEDAATREVTFPVGPARTMTMPGEAYLNRVAIPNVYFHLATAHAILRAAGVPVGKYDFLGMAPPVASGSGETI